MSPSSGNVSVLRLPTLVWVVLFAFMFPGFFFILGGSYRPAGKDWADDVLLIVVSALIAANFCFALRNRELILARLPAWLRPYWVRVGVFIAFEIFLVVLRPPHFDDSVFRQGAIFLVLPYLLAVRRPAWKFLEAASVVNPGKVDSDEDMVLPCNPRKAMLFILGAGVLVAAGVFMRQQYPVAAWFVICSFGLAIPLGVLMLIPGCTCLILRKEDFVTVYTWRRYSFRWNEVSDIGLLSLSENQSVVAFNFSEEPSENSPNGRRRMKRRKWVRDTYGKDMLLSPQYDVSPAELCRMMNQRRDRFLVNGARSVR